jgi:PhnB protein
MAAIPTQYQRVTPYLTLPKAGAFVTFAKTVFGATLNGDPHLREDGSIMHAELAIGGSAIMCADATAEYPAMPAGLFIWVEDADTSFALALQHGCTEIMPPANQDYGRACGVRDAHGNMWWITAALG